MADNHTDISPEIKIPGWLRDHIIRKYGNKDKEEIFLSYMQWNSLLQAKEEIPQRILDNQVIKDFSLTLSYTGDAVFRIEVQSSADSCTAPTFYLRKGMTLEETLDGFNECLLAAGWVDMPKLKYPEPKLVDKVPREKEIHIPAILRRNKKVGETLEY